MDWVEVVVALVILLGLVGIVIPILPGGSLLVGAAVLGWAIWLDQRTGWIVLAIAAALLAVGIVVKYLVPGRRLQAAGIPLRTQVIGVLLAVIGFFVIPVIGFLIGFVVGIYLAEAQRLGAGPARASTWLALKAAGLSILIDLTAALLATATWAVGVLAT